MRGIFNQSCKLTNRRLVFDYDGSVSIPRVKEGWYRLTVVATGIISTSNNIISHFHFLNRTQEYRIYWGAWDYPSQFPNGVNFTIGSSNESVDWNYIHWSRFGPTFIRNETVTGTWSSVVRIFNNLTQFRWGTPDISKWQIHFELDEAPSENSIAMFTMQLAGVETMAGTIKSCWSMITFPQRPASMRWLVASSDSTGDLYQ
ncbi:hypothetical protein DFH05DRAFT_1471824 [Lentinula detonsa]|uniref:Rhamnogalacturonan lyase domain-containing protein n=1 Tax=Lentinula detonsa TaxID=2804962 RepID=A0A9W8U4D8_9AGAR|nr:hypothetical protein DFH05DRAFT_1471824 [Lentinula detonsa]